MCVCGSVFLSDGISGSLCHSEPCMSACLCVRVLVDAKHCVTVCHVCVRLCVCVVQSEH